jgi:hypothetical protein
LFIWFFLGQKSHSRAASWVWTFFPILGDIIKHVRAATSMSIITALKKNSGLF